MIKLIVLKGYLNWWPCSGSTKTALSCVVLWDFFEVDCLLVINPFSFSWVEDLARPEREWPTQDQRTQWPNCCHLITRFSIVFQYHFHLFSLMADLLWCHHWFEFLTVYHYPDLGISTFDWFKICSTNQKKSTQI